LAAFLMALPGVGVTGFRTARYDTDAEILIAGS
jgi:hypothetical protein